jgi:hypothetical protein
MNARDISGRTLLHHIPQEAPRRRRHFGSDYAPPQFDLKQLIAAGADPFFWSQDMMTGAFFDSWIQGLSLTEVLQYHLQSVLWGLAQG